MTTATAFDAAAAETCACARCGARVITPDYRPAWIYDGLCMDCAAARPLCADCGQPFRHDPSGCAGHGCQEPVTDHDRKVEMGFLSTCAAADCRHS